MYESGSTADEYTYPRPIDHSSISVGPRPIDHSSIGATPGQLTIHQSVAPGRLTNLTIGATPGQLPLIHASLSYHVFVTIGATPGQLPLIPCFPLVSCLHSGGGEGDTGGGGRDAGRRVMGTTRGDDGENGGMVMEWVDE